MAKKAAISFEALMNMGEEEFLTFCEKQGIFAELSKICDRTTEQRIYPKVLKPMKKPTPAQIKKKPGLLEHYEKNKDKLTWQADKTQKPKIVAKPITFFEVKAAIATEVLHIEKKVAPEKLTFRDRVANKAANL